MTGSTHPVRGLAGAGQQRTFASCRRRESPPALDIVRDFDMWNLRKVFRKAFNPASASSEDELWEE